MPGYQLLDTGKFQEFLDSSSSLLDEYNNLNKQYGEIIDELLDNWKGRGAEAFESDSKTVKANIAGIQDILQTMCDMLQDCWRIFDEYDHSLGEANIEVVIQ